MLNIIGAIVAGLIVGGLARFFYPGEVEMGWLSTIALGIGGSLLASLAVSRGRWGGARLPPARLPRERTRRDGAYTDRAAAGDRVTSAGALGTVERLGGSRRRDHEAA